MDLILEELKKTMKKRGKNISWTLYQMKDVLQKLNELKEISEECNQYYNVIIESLKSTFEELKDLIQTKMGSYDCKFEDLNSLKELENLD